MREFIKLFETEEPEIKLSRKDLLIESVDEWTPEKINRAVRGYGIAVDGPPEAQQPAGMYSWSYDRSYPVAWITAGDNVSGIDGWENWMRNEMKMWTEEGQPDRYDSMFSEPIYDPVILVETNDIGYLWDGCHRTGASVMQNRQTIPALVGRLIK